MQLPIRRPTVPQALFALVLVLFLAANLVNVASPIVEAHGFRQTQTAIAAYYFITEGFTLRYLTPVMGEPWSNPFEFPLYQAIVAAIVKAVQPFTTSPLLTLLTTTGRIVSMLFMLLSLIPLYAGLKRLQVTPDARWFSLALTLSAPVYFFWSGTFLMETAALCFTLSFLYYALKLWQRHYGTATFLLCGLFLTLALLQKITTALPVLAVVSLCIAVSLFRSGELHPHNLRRNLFLLLKLAASVLIPLALALLWVKFSDSVKLENPLAAHLSSSSLAGWNYGTLAQRLSFKLWGETILMRNMGTASCFFLGLIMVIAALNFMPNVPERRLVALAAALFLLPFVLFTNLHIVHNYYQAANTVFWSVAVGLSTVWLGTRYLKNYPRFYTGLLALFILSNLTFFAVFYGHHKFAAVTLANNRNLRVATFIRTHTPPQLPVIWSGFDTSSEPTFYAERKSLSLPFWRDITAQAISHPQTYLSQPPSALINCLNPEFPAHFTKVDQLAAAAYPGAALLQIDDCHIYLLTTNNAD